MNSILGYKKRIDEIRNYERPDQSRHLADDIDSEIVDTLVESVSERFDIAKRYYKLKAKILGVKKLAYHERNISISLIDKEISYEDGFKLVYEV